MMVLPMMKVFCGKMWGCDGDVYVKKKKAVTNIIAAFLEGGVYTCCAN